MNDILTLGVLAVGGYLIYTKTDWFQQGLDTIKDLVGEIKGGGGGGPLIDLGGGGAPAAPSGGGSAAISQGGSCPGGTNCGPCRPQSGGIRCECNNYKGSSYEATFCGTWSGDDLSIKMWGPTHSGSNCCWCILNTSPDGKMRMRGEGPHPTTKDLGVTGSVGGKPTCVKAVITQGPKGAHVEGYGLVGGKWVKGLTYDGPCGLGSNVLRSAHANQQVSFRCDGQMKATCATVKPIANANYASAGQYTNSLFTYNRPYTQSKILNVI